MRTRGASASRIPIERGPRTEKPTPIDLYTPSCSWRRGCLLARHPKMCPPPAFGPVVSGVARSPAVPGLIPGALQPAVVNGRSLLGVWLLLRWRSLDGVDDVNPEPAQWGTPSCLSPAWRP
jgi:hypothetical protein